MRPDRESTSNPSVDGTMPNPVSHSGDGLAIFYISVYSMRFLH